MPELRAATLVVMSVALLLAATGLLLWHLASRTQARRASSAFLDRRIQAPPEPVAPAADPWRTAVGVESSASLAERLGGNPWIDGNADGSGAPAVAAAPPTGWGQLQHWTVPLPGWLEGIVTGRTLLLLGMGIVVFSLLTAALAGALAAIAAAVLACLLTVFGLWLRIQKIRRQLVRQLPGFIDSMVRLITIGNSTQASFQLAIASTATPLQGYLERAASLVRAGVDLDRALHQTAAQVGIEEMSLLASILGLGVRYGGRADLLLERVAAFMRDREQAENELMAMSAETRLSAWVLGLLPVAVTAFIIIVNPDYFLRMWTDPTGRWLIYAAMALQLTGVGFLYRLARLP